MSAFSDDHTKDMNNPEYAYEFGRNERELEIIKLLEEHEDNWRCREGCCEGFGWDGDKPINQLTLLTTLIKGEK